MSGGFLIIGSQYRKKAKKRKKKKERRKKGTKKRRKKGKKHQRETMLTILNQVVKQNVEKYRLFTLYIICVRFCFCCFVFFTLSPQSQFFLQEPRIWACIGKLIHSFFSNFCSSFTFLLFFLFSFF